MRKIAYSFGIVTCIITLSAIAPRRGAARPDSAAAPTRQVQWAWRKNFKDIDLRNISLAWNGSRLVFSATEKTGPNTSRGDIIVGCMNNGGVVRDWLSRGKVRRLCLNGEGKKLLMERADGSLLYQDDWTLNREPVPVRKGSAGAVLSPRGDYILVSEPVSSSGGRNYLRAISPAGKVLWTCPRYPSKKLLAIVPFLEKDRQVLSIAKNNDLVLSDGPSTVWKDRLPGNPVALASSFLQGGVAAVSTGGENGEVRFYNSVGKLTGRSPFPGGAVSLSCSNTGNICAALSNDRREQRLSVFTPDGKETWRYTLAGPASSPSSVVVTGQGNVVIAGFEDKGTWSLRAWDAAGKPLWTAPVDGGITEFRVSWSGKRIAVLTKIGRVVFFDLTEKK